MNDAILNVAAEVEEFLQTQNWKFCVIGGLAVLRWGRPRLTEDVDLSLLTRFGRETPYINTLLSRFSARIPDALEFAEKNRVLLLQSNDGVGIDIALVAFPFEEEMINRASKFEYRSGVKLTTISAEDLVIMKAFAGRGRDWLDVTGIVQLHGKSLDWRYIDFVLEGLQELRPEADFIAQLAVIRKTEGAK